MNRNILEDNVLVDIDADVAFNVAKRLLGDGRSNLQYIQKETGAYLTLRGGDSGDIDPVTGIVIQEPLYICIEHRSSYEAVKVARKLALDLVETVRDDWYIYKKRNNSQSGGGGMERNNYSERHRQNDRDIGYRKRERDSFSRAHTQEYDSDGSDQYYRSRYDRPPDSSDWKENKRGQDETRSSRGNNEWGRQGATESSNSNDAYRNASKAYNDKNQRQGDWIGGRSDKQHRQQEERDSSNWNRSRVGRMDSSSDYLASNRDLETDIKKPRWGNSLPFNNEGSVLDQERSKEKQLDKVDPDMCPALNNPILPPILPPIFPPIFPPAFPPVMPPVMPPVIPPVMPPMVPMIPPVDPSGTVGLGGGGLLNPLQMNQDQLFQLNHSQLLQVSQQQQALLMQIASGITSNPVQPTVSEMGSTSFQSWEKTGTKISLSGVPNLQPPCIQSDKSGLKNVRGNNHYLSDDEISDDGGHLSFTRKELMKRHGDHNSLTFSNKKRKSFDDLVQMPNRMGKERNSPKQEHSSTSRNLLYPSPEDIFSSRALNQGRFLSETQDIYYSADRGNERYSPQLNDGQERYSPQLNDEYQWQDELRKKGWPRHADEMQNKDRSNRALERHREEEERKMRSLMKYRVGLVDKGGDKLGLDDEEEVRTLILRKNQGLRRPHKIEYIGLSCEDYVISFLPISLEGERWMTSLSSLKGRSRTYTLFPYEDVFKRYRLRTTLFFDTLDGYQPTEGEVIMEIGRINEDLNTDQWKVIKFKAESKGYFMMVSVDFLSYLRLGKIKWKPRYRTTYIRLEPIRSEKGVIDPLY